MTPTEKECVENEKNPLYYHDGHGAIFKRCVMTYDEDKDTARATMGFLVCEVSKDLETETAGEFIADALRDHAKIRPLERELNELKSFIKGAATNILKSIQ